MASGSSPSVSEPSSRQADLLLDLAEELPEECPQILENKKFILTKGGGSNKNYSKLCMMEIIERHGGEVFNSAENIGDTANTYLIADRPYCTIAYIGALSLNIPPVSYRWIVDCVRGNVLENFENYRIPAGYINGEVIPFKVTDNVLTGLTIGVYNHASHTQFSTFFKFVVENLGGTYVPLPLHFTDINEAFRKPEEKCDYVLIRKRSHQKDIVAAAKAMDIKPVYPEWLIYALLTREVDLSEQYHATVEKEIETADSEEEVEDDESGSSPDSGLDPAA
uniref:BRCT domain-containing protein n=1 Tax=Panagrellus redivivus TaxID=6233 RepID=A0A7E5A0E5_PANRE